MGDQNIGEFAKVGCYYRVSHSGQVIYCGMLKFRYCDINHNVRSILQNNKSFERLCLVSTHKNRMNLVKLNLLHMQISFSDKQSREIVGQVQPQFVVPCIQMHSSDG